MSPSITDAAYKSMVASCRQALDSMFADMPRTPPFDVMAVRMWARGFLTSLVSLSRSMSRYLLQAEHKTSSQDAYRNLAGDVEDLDINQMLREASSLVERFAEDSWLGWAAELMPNIAARVEREREAEEKRRADEERRVEIENRRQQRREEQGCRAAQKERERADREAAASRLSPTSSRTAPRKTSQSSLVSAGADLDVLASEDDISGSQRTTRGGKKGKAKATEVAYQDPKFKLPKNAELVSSTVVPRCGLLLMQVLR